MASLIKTLAATAAFAAVATTAQAQQPQPSGFDEDKQVIRHASHIRAAQEAVTACFGKISERNVDKLFEKVEKADPKDTVTVTAGKSTVTLACPYTMAVIQAQQVELYKGTQLPIALGEMLDRWNESMQREGTACQSRDDLNIRGLSYSVTLQKNCP